jgi:hypothetical protein
LLRKERLPAIGAGPFFLRPQRPAATGIRTVQPTGRLTLSRRRREWTAARAACRLGMHPILPSVGATAPAALTARCHIVPQL